MIALDTNILIYACDKADLRRQQVALDLVWTAGDGARSLRPGGS
jgi:predicted nucleic acid-binding protein